MKVQIISDAEMLKSFVPSHHIALLKPKKPMPHLKNMCFLVKNVGAKQACMTLAQAIRDLIREGHYSGKAQTRVTAARIAARISALADEISDELP